METVLHKASTRGISDHGWLSSRFSFSFADWYEPTRMGFGALRVINDDTIASHSGFPAHSHRDMEIITIVTSGAVSHTDSMGNSYDVPAGDVQVMSAGTGVTHAEFNRGDEALQLFQIWITPKADGLPSRYEQKTFSSEGETLLVSPDGRNGSLSIQQDAYITRVEVHAGDSFTYHQNNKHNGTYIFMIEGGVEVCAETIGKRDALGVWGNSTITIVAKVDSSFLCIEVPR